MKPIGGYFELDLRRGEEYHKNAIGLNTGRNALELILRIKQYSKVFIPYYTCDVIIEPFNKIGINYEFYSIDTNFEPLFDYATIKDNEAFLYVNYFGLKDTFISDMECKNLIIDNSQAFFALPLPGIPTFYSCRKFFGVPDGAYLYLEDCGDLEFPVDYSSERMKHLFSRIECGAEAGYDEFKVNENDLIGQPIKQMSKLTRELLLNIDYNFVAKRRRDNYATFASVLINNKIDLPLNGNAVPYCYPLLTDVSNLRSKLISNKVFIPAFWPNVIINNPLGSIEQLFCDNLLALPIDQRLDEIDITRILNLL